MSSFMTDITLNAVERPVISVRAVALISFSKSLGS